MSLLCEVIAMLQIELTPIEAQRIRCALGIVQKELEIENINMTLSRIPFNSERYNTNVDTINHLKTLTKKLGGN